LDIDSSASCIGGIEDTQLYVVLVLVWGLTPNVEDAFADRKKESKNTS